MTEGISTYRFWHRPSIIPNTWDPIYICGVLNAYKKIASFEGKFDLIHAQGFVAGVPSVILSMINKIPVLVTEHFSAFPRKMLSKARVISAHIVFKKADLVLPVCRALQKGIESYGIDARFKIIPNTVDGRIFYPPSEEKKQNDKIILLFAGHLNEVKGISYLLFALSRIKNINWQLNILGNGTKRMEYENLSRYLGIDNRVIFHGHQAKGKLADFMRNSDIFVLPSIWENMPCVLIEAMTTGLPIISTTAGGIPEIVEKEIGILVPPCDSEKLAESLLYMMMNRDKYNRGLIVDKAKKYSLETVGDELNNIYIDITRNRNVKQ